MALPTINDVGAVNPVLTNMLISYMQDDARFVASRAFPAVTVENDSGTYYILTKKYFFFDDLRLRAPGADFSRMGFGVSTDTYTTLQWGAEIPLAVETQANSQVPLSLGTAALRRLAQASLIRKEVQFATDFMTTSVWGTDDNNSTTDWDDFSSGDPANDIITASRTISNNTGYDANTMILGYIVHQALTLHPDILDRVKYTRAATKDVIEGAIGAALGIPNYLVAKGSYTNTNETASFTASAIIDDDCLVCYVDPAGATLDGATAGKTFVWPGGGGAGEIYTYHSDERRADIYQHREQWDQKATATDMGYFFADVV